MKGRRPATGDGQPEDLAIRMLRLPLAVAGLLLVAVTLGLDQVGPGRAAAQFGVKALLAAYLLAGVLNLARFPRTLRGPPPARTEDAWLLDGWTVVALFSAAAAIHDGTVASLL